MLWEGRKLNKIFFRLYRINTKEISYLPELCNSPETKYWISKKDKFYVWKENVRDIQKECILSNFKFMVTKATVFILR